MLIFEQPLFNSELDEKYRISVCDLFDIGFNF